jgi:DNA processing protein
VELERAAHVALALTPGVGAARFGSLVAACQSAHGVLLAPSRLLCSIPGIPAALADDIKRRTVADGERVLGEVRALGGVALVPGDPDFPTSLRQIPEPPPLLFARGDLRLLRRPAVAIVGSRDHSAYGAAACRLIAGTAARAGAVVVSGMARGLDAIAHQAALDAGGGTIGVLGNGLGVVYPAANGALYRRVAGRGLLLTEFPPGERPHAGSFPRRNRLISGLARVTVVVEAALGSGALITAEAALEQGREVLAVPGPITSAVSGGVNRLIRDGAAPLLEPADLLQHFPELGPAPTAAAWLPEPATLPRGLSPAERALAERLGDQPMHVDQVAARVGRPAHEVLAALCSLELAGVVEQRPGSLFRRI